MSTAKKPCRCYTDIEAGEENGATCPLKVVMHCILDGGSCVEDNGEEGNGEGEEWGRESCSLYVD